MKQFKTFDYNDMPDNLHDELHALVGEGWQHEAYNEQHVGENDPDSWELDYMPGGQDARQKIDQWLIEHGAENDTTVLISIWW